MDFMQDTLVDGRAVRILTVMDIYTRECLAAVPAGTFRGDDVVRVLSHLAAKRSRPQRNPRRQWRRVHFESARPLDLLQRCRTGLQPAREARR